MITLDHVMERRALRWALTGSATTSCALNFSTHPVKHLNWNLPSEVSV